MGGHRRDQSDSHVPLRPSGDFSCASNDGFELQVSNVRPSMSSLSGAEDGGGDAGGGEQHRRAHTNNNHSNTLMRQNGDVVRIEVGDCDDTQPHPHDLSSISARAAREGARCAKSDAVKTLAAFFCLMVSAFLNFFLLTIIHDIAPTQPLPDLTFKLIPQQRWAWSLGDVLSTVNSIVAFTCIAMHQHRWVVLRRLFLLGAILYGLRACVMGVTFLPPSFDNRDQICQPQVNRTTMYATEIATRFVTYVVTLGLTSGQDKILCGDLMFSGHTVVLTLMYFVQLQYTPRGLWWLRYLAAPITFCGIAALVVSGGHYTMDVFVAYWLTSHVFWSYHQIFEMRKAERAAAPLSRLWWFWLCYWFEAEVPEGRLANRWSWPFPGPAIAHKLMDRVNHKLE
ncbi:hypothetical protein PMAYCL1PPCAC_33483 [Pristionchus mayeri]|uniref:Sphingomyelin synthase-like domain-containing protein n=1 Tax=Pristionchus mayeri TaxID=1317129 RepID=A0AAN4Z4N9_9BILA|nr:hypothetical protein PMAYCL1PPCAC_00825 [Pristionchus mayeri]GMR63288.1 hypothetical protein PMAYCL1PPCAC_33483 [Pristionchus mayeri]